MTAVTARGLARSFASTRVLTSIDLDVERGEHVTISGANGAGKTTLLRILAGLLRPTAGDVTVLGGSTDDPRVRRRIGVISHANGLYPRMTAAENIRFWSGMYEAGDGRRVGAEVLDALGLDPSDARTVSAYSQGMRRRVAVARALAISPDLVLADEPFAGIDADGAAVVGELLAGVETVLVATHTPGAGRSLVLRNGRLAPA